jgi:chorismate dehydratase
MERGPQKNLFDLTYALPSACADQVASGAADIGILPVAEIERQRLAWLPETGIACHGPVRSILLISKVAPARIRTLAADSGSRTSVMLARVLLAEQHGTEPRIVPAPADLEPMLEIADAALIIGDPALRLDPVELGRRCHVADLGGEWVSLTGLPMVFALWGGKAENVPAELGEQFLASCRFGSEHLDEIVRAEAPRRGIPQDLAREYLTRHIVTELSDRDMAGFHTFLRHARELEARRAVTA